MTTVIQNWFFDKVLNKFRHPHANDNVSASKKFILFDVTYVEKPSHRFCENISRLILKVSGVKIMPIYRAFKVGNYFKLKSHTPLAFVSNIVCRFTSSFDAVKIYNDMSCRDLITRARKRLNLNNRKNCH